MRMRRYVLSTLKSVVKTIVKYVVKYIVKTVVKYVVKSVVKNIVKPVAKTIKRLNTAQGPQQQKQRRVEMRGPPHIHSYNKHKLINLSI